MTPVLWHAVRAYRLDPAAREDLVQETWTTFMRCHESISDPQAVASWLLVTARRSAARTAGRARRWVATDDETLGRSLPDEASAEQVAVLDDQTARLWAVVRTLDERCQRLLRVVAFQERPDYASLTEELHMPVGSIGPTRARCLAKVRRALEAGGHA
jgi:RNA polymerase sigma factor (sigma-70 family)